VVEGLGAVIARLPPSIRRRQLLWLYPKR
jgi:hypothetical protein